MCIDHPNCIPWHMIFICISRDQDFVLLQACLHCFFQIQMLFVLSVRVFFLNLSCREWDWLQNNHKIHRFLIDCGIFPILNLGSLPGGWGDSSRRLWDSGKLRILQIGKNKWCLGGVILAKVGRLPMCETEAGLVDKLLVVLGLSGIFRKVERPEDAVQFEKTVLWSVKQGWLYRPP